MLSVREHAINQNSGVETLLSKRAKLRDKLYHELWSAYDTVCYHTGYNLEIRKYGFLETHVKLGESLFAVIYSSWMFFVGFFLLNPNLCDSRTVFVHLFCSKQWHCND